MGCNWNIRNRVFVFPVFIRWTMVNNIITIFGTGSRVKILAEIFRMVEQKQEVYIRKLVQVTGLTSQTVTNHISELEKEGIITRVQIEGAPTKFIHLQDELKSILKSISEMSIND